MLEGRKHPRTRERFLVQISALHDPRLAELVSVENISSHGVRVTMKVDWPSWVNVTTSMPMGNPALYCGVTSSLSAEPLPSMATPRPGNSRIEGGMGTGVGPLVGPDFEHAARAKAEYRSTFAPSAIRMPLVASASTEVETALVTVQVPKALPLLKFTPPPPPMDVPPV